MKHLQTRSANPSKNMRRNVVVALGFAAIIALSFLVAYIAGSHSSPQQACQKQCSSVGKQGHLVYTGPATPKSSYKEAQSECRCQ